MTRGIPRSVPGGTRWPSGAQDLSRVTEVRKWSGGKKAEWRTLLSLQMSNEIIRLCCHSISLDRIFEGYVNSSKEDLEGCISCCQAWKEHYLRAVQMHTQ